MHLRNLGMLESEPMILSVMLGGALGAVSRYLIALALQASRAPQLSDSLSFATFTVNTVGSFCLAFLVFSFGDSWRPELKLGLTTGFLGSFTTFSTFELETLQLVEKGDYLLAFSYVVLSVVIGFAAALLGRWLALQLN